MHLRKYEGKASSAYEIRLEKEKEACKGERERAQEQKEISAKLEQEKKQLLQKKKDLKEDGEHIVRGWKKKQKSTLKLLIYYYNKQTKHCRRPYL